MNSGSPRLDEGVRSKTVAVFDGLRPVVRDEHKAGHGGRQDVAELVNLVLIVSGENEGAHGRKN